jgi:chemotaxis protein methyltransferase CheR
LGIKLPEAKRNMLSGRLCKRLRALRLDSFSVYCDFVFSPAGQETEIIHLLDAVTTNKTDFFREPNHFKYLTGTVLPECAARRVKQLRVWSAGCSTGEEPYTLAMVLSDYQQSNPGLGFTFDILATDISTRVLDVARKAVYHEDRVVPVPPLFRKKFLLKGTGDNQDLARVCPEQRSRVRFGRLNFMAADFRLPKTQHVVFCRNVLIYFDKKTQESVINKICQYLEPGGFLFLGHSETILGYKVPLVQEAPTVYRRLA